MVSFTSGGDGAALAGPSSCVDMVPSAERYRGVPNRAQSLQMADLSFEQSYLHTPKNVLYDPQPRFREFVPNGVILVRKTCLSALFERRHVRHQTASKASLC